MKGLNQSGLNSLLLNYVIIAWTFGRIAEKNWRISVFVSETATIRFVRDLGNYASPLHLQYYYYLALLLLSSLLVLILIVVYLLTRGLLHPLKNIWKFKFNKFQTLTQRPSHFLPGHNPPGHTTSKASSTLLRRTVEGQATWREVNGEGARETGTKEPVFNPLTHHTPRFFIWGRLVIG